MTETETDGDGMRGYGGATAKRNRGNASLVAGFLAFIFLALIFRFAVCQIVPLALPARAAVVWPMRPAWRHEKTLVEQSHRGLILDRHGRPLAVSWYEHVLVVDPAELASRRSEEQDVAALRMLPLILEEVGARLLDRYERDEAEFQRALFCDTRLDEQGRTLRVRHRVLSRGMTPRSHRLLREKLALSGLSGFSFERRVRRTYPCGESMAQVVGIVGSTKEDSSVRGRAGVEQSMEHYLRGTAGVLRAELDALGRELLLGETWSRSPRQGSDVVLTVDCEIQRMAYRVLRDQWARHDCRATSAVVLSVASGEILAVCSYPSADPENLDSADMKRLGLPAIQHVYTPGSTIKPVFLSWALHKGVIDTEETFDCGGHNGWRHFGRRDVKEFGRNPNPLTIAGIIMRSSNVGTVRICLERLGMSGIFDAMDAFGVASKVDVCFPAVPNHPCTTRREARPGYTGPAFPQGYEMALSPLGVARIYLTLARNGEQVEPSLIKEVRTPAGVLRAEIRRRPVLRPAPVAVVLRAMKEAVENPRGTGRRARSERWTIAAKTGTGQADNKPGKNLYNAWFCGIAPADAPEILVVVHTHLKRRKGRPYTGGAVSGPPARELIESVLEYLRLKPDRVPETGR